MLNLSQVRLDPSYFARSHELTGSDAAAIYLLHKEQYLPSAEAIRSGEGVNDNASIRFEAGKTYKIRIINMSALASEFPTSLKAFIHPVSEMGRDELIRQCSTSRLTNMISI